MGHFCKSKRTLPVACARKSISHLVPVRNNVAHQSLSTIWHGLDRTKDTMSCCMYRLNEQALARYSWDYECTVNLGTTSGYLTEEPLLLRSSGETFEPYDEVSRKTSAEKKTSIPLYHGHPGNARVVAAEVLEGELKFWRLTSLPRKLSPWAKLLT